MKESQDPSLLVSALQHSISQNLSQARHVETERLTLLSIYTAVTAGIIGFFASAYQKMPLLAMLLLGALLIISILVHYQVSRWHSVFNRHWDAAKAGSNRLKQLTGIEPACEFQASYRGEKKLGTDTVFLSAISLVIIVLFIACVTGLL